MRPRTEQFANYFDEHPSAKPWFKRGRFKRYYRNKWFKKLFRDLDC